jgi:hypothetical protein
MISEGNIEMKGKILFVVGLRLREAIHMVPFRRRCFSQTIHIFLVLDAHCIRYVYCTCFQGTYKSYK